MIGVKGGSTSLLTTGVYGVVKTAVTILYVGYLVDRIGRRLPLLVGATLQATSMLYLALYLRFAGTSTGSVGGTPAGGIVGIIFIYVYAFGWSFGHSVACYVVAAEVFPTRIVSIDPREYPWRQILTVFSDLSAWLSVSSSIGLWITALRALRPI